MRDWVLQRRAKVLRNRPTDAERHLWRFLRGRQLAGYRLRRQVALESYIADFACLEAGLVVELDGSQYLAQRRYDDQRDERLQAAGFRVLRFWDNDVLRDTQAVVELILGTLAACPHPSLPPQAGEGEPHRRSRLSDPDEAR